MPTPTQLATALRRPKHTDKVGKVMHEFKAGTLHSGSDQGPVVQNVSRR